MVESLDCSRPPADGEGDRDVHCPLSTAAHGRAGGSREGVRRETCTRSAPENHCPSAARGFQDGRLPPVSGDTGQRGGRRAPGRHCPRGSARQLLSSGGRSVCGSVVRGAQMWGLSVCRLPLTSVVGRRGLITTGPLLPACCPQSGATSLGLSLKTQEDPPTPLGFVVPQSPATPGRGVRIVPVTCSLTSSASLQHLPQRCSVLCPSHVPCSLT